MEVCRLHTTSGLKRANKVDHIEVIIHSLSLRRPILKLPQAHKGMVSGLTFTSHKNDMHRQLLSCGSLDMTIKLWKVSHALTGHLSRTAIDMEEGEALDEYGRNAFADVGGNGRLDRMLDEDQARLDLDLDEEEGGFMEAEGGGLNLDEEKRQKAAERLEVGSFGRDVVVGTDVFLSAYDGVSRQTWFQVSCSVMPDCNGG